MQMRSVVGVALLGTVLAASPSWAPPAAAHVPTDLQQLTSQCNDVLFVGARGSGQEQGGVTTRNDPNYDGGTGFGPQVFSAYNAFAAGVLGPRRIVSSALEYSALDVPFSARPASWQNYFKGLEAGVRTSLTTLDERRKSCPDERIVLAGYSQGAMVMHRTMTRLQLAAEGRGPLRKSWSKKAARKVLARIDGVILIADGDRIPRDRTIRYGTAGEAFGGVGWEFRGSGVSGTSNTKFTKSLKPRIHSICNARDVVCDHVAPASMSGIGTHTKYTNTPPVTSAAANVARRVVGMMPIPAGVVIWTGNNRYGTRLLLATKRTGRSFQAWYDYTGGAGDAFGCVRGNLTGAKLKTRELPLWPVEYVTSRYSLVGAADDLTIRRRSGKALLLDGERSARFAASTFDQYRADAGLTSGQAAEQWGNISRCLG